ncbi:MAG TPA: hypothetical protein VFH63_03530 [candidate division Zixibacteria bacterium]|nr:hypothetical protein [candidate division Zixibacteria bacterium]
MTGTVGPATPASPLHRDLLALLEALERLEHDLFGGLSADAREAHATGSWSARDVRAHLAAWRGIEARRLRASLRDGAPADAGDPAPGDPVDEANARLHAERAGWSWEAVADDADDSLHALREAVAASEVDVLCECDGTVAGIGANGVNHGIAHLSDVALLAGEEAAARYAAFSREVEAILVRNHLPPRDSGVLLYNLACHAGLTGDVAEARRLLHEAISRRHELADAAQEDPDLAALRAASD